MMKRFFVAAATLLLVGATQNASAATQIVNAAGKMTGATGVVVNGAVYNVTFVDGTCAGVYGTCSTSSFDFSSEANAAAAADALLDQVFLDTPAGLFDTRPEKTNGCTSVFTCTVSVAFGVLSNGWRSAVVENGTNEFNDINGVGFDGFVNDTTSSATRVIARFSLENVAAVPEPATWAMMLVGFGMIGAASRYRRRRTAITYV